MSDQAPVHPNHSTTSPSEAKFRKKRAWVWEHFTEINFADPKTKRRATYAYCKQNFSCNPSKNVTDSLACHLTEHCSSEENPFIVREEDDDLLKGQARLGFKPFKHGETSKELISVSFTSERALQ